MSVVAPSQDRVSTCDVPACFHEQYERRFSTGFESWLTQSKLIPQATCAEEPFFSVIIAVYNGESMIGKCLKSIQLQDFTDFEIIVIDDASTDCTTDVVEQIARTDARIKLICLKRNAGSSPARNAGVRAACGKYIRICDADDFYPPEALSAFTRPLADCEVDLIAGNLVHWHSHDGMARRNPDTTFVDRNVRSNHLMDLPELWVPIHFHRCAFRRIFLLENQIEYSSLWRGGDPVYLSTVLTKAKSFALIKEPVYLFHSRPRNHRFSYKQIRDAYAAHTWVQQCMTDAGYRKIAFLFTLTRPPCFLSHAGVTEEESFALSSQLIDIIRGIPPESWQHPFLQNFRFDAARIMKSFQLFQASSPEDVSQLIRKGRFSPAAHRKKQSVYRRARRFTERLGRQIRSRMHCNPDGRSEKKRQ